MAPSKKKANASTVSTVGATAAAVAPNAPRAKRSRTSATVAVAKAVEEEANNSTHMELVRNDNRHTEASLPEDYWAGPLLRATSGVVREAYEVMQKQLDDFCQELQSLRQHHLVAATPTSAILGLGPAAGGGVAPALAAARSEPVL